MGAELSNPKEPPWDVLDAAQKTNYDLSQQGETAKGSTEDIVGAEVRTQKALNKASKQVTFMTLHKSAPEGSRVMEEGFGILTLGPSYLGPGTLPHSMGNPSKPGLKVPQAENIPTSTEQELVQLLNNRPRKTWSEHLSHFDRPPRAGT